MLIKVRYDHLNNICNGSYSINYILPTVYTFPTPKKRCIRSKILLCFKLTSISNTNLISHLPDDLRNTGIMPK